MKYLSNLAPGCFGYVVKVGGKGAFRRRLIDMGITPGVKINMVRFAPFGDPIQINLRGYDLSIRKSEAKEIILSDQITVTELSNC